MKHENVLDLTAIGCELEIYVSDIDLQMIKSSRDFFEAVKGIVSDYDQRRECFPVDLELEEEGESSVVCKSVLTGSFVEAPPKGILRIFQSAVSKRAHYYFKCRAGEEVIFETKNFLGYKVVTEIKQGELVIDFDDMEPGRPNEEPIGYMMLSPAGELIQSTTNEYFCISEDDWDDESEKRLKEIADEWYAEIFGVAN